MEKPEFEEKEYEAPLYQQLLGGSRRIATPGQVFEFAFGPDACLEALNPAFWNIAGFSHAPQGAILNDFSWGWVWRVFGSTRRLPTFSVNLLVQAKRPDFMAGSRANFKQFGFTKNYWRFFTRDHQQAALCRLSETLGNRAFVVYASPAFHKLTDLYEHTDRGTIVENSTFVKPDLLRNHRSWNYSRPGTSGVAASKPEGFEGASFDEVLAEKIASSKPESVELEFSAVYAAVERTAYSLEKNPIADRFREIIEPKTRNETVNSDYTSAIEFQRSILFFRLLGVEWFIAGGESEVVPHEMTKSR